MDRETRRANFKKLQQQQPATTKLRSTRSSKAVAATTTLSDYFSTQESATNEEVTQQPELQDDLFAEPTTKKTRESHDTKPKPKKAPKLKSSAPARRGRGRPSKQPSISDFLRNEQLFSEVTAQHCMADNFSPDDIEMALALSKSEAEKHGALRLQDTMDGKEEEEVVNLLDNKGSQSTENIRRKLQKYGFRTAAKEDYNVLSIGVLPGAAGRRGKRCKWANKFTALTLRNPEEQLMKVNNKVAALMAQQVRTKLPSAEDLQMLPIQLISARLQQLEATSRITHEPSEGSITNLSAYYVEELIEVGKTPADHLLKSWTAIQGRDLSPKRPSEKSLLRQQQLEQIYAELEAHFGAGAELAKSPAAEQAELDELQKLVADHMVEEKENSSILKEPPDKRARMSETPSVIEYDQLNPQPCTSSMLTVVELEDSSSSGSCLLKEPPDKENLQPSTASIDTTVKQQKESLRDRCLLKEPPDKTDRIIETQQERENMQPSSSSLLTLPTQTTRCTSPDLFADSDDEDDLELKIPMLQNFSLRVYKDTTSKNINCYEIYSSDEVKTPVDTKEEQEAKKEQEEQEAEKEHTNKQFVESFVDLTEEQDSTELPDTKKSILQQQILTLSPTIEFDDEIDVVNCTLAGHIDKVHEDCVISDEIYAKYAPKSEEQKEMHRDYFNTSKSSFRLTTSPLSSKDDNSMATTSFHLATTPHSSKDSSLSFPRSFSLTQALNLEPSFKSPRNNSFTDKPASESNLEHSFKSPLSRKSNSFNDKPASVCSHSDVSIDLTQDSCDDEDNDHDPDDDGVLLSDDEINYSIWKADKTQRGNDMELALHEDGISPLRKRKTMPYFKTIEDLDAYLDASPAASLQSCNSRSPNKSALSKERAEFGILDAALSQPFTLSQLPSEKAETSQVHIDWAEASFLDPPTAELPMKRYSSSSHKFKELINIIPDNPNDDELDEFDRMVFQNAKDATIDQVPSGLDRLLLGDINLDSLPESGQAVPRHTPAPVPEQLEVNGQLYTVRVCQSPKPDFVHMTEPELLQHLYNYGIKPLKRKQAVKLLEFIYNQTHPIMLPLEEESQVESMPLPRSKSTPVTRDGKSKPRKPLLQSVSNDCLTPTEVDPKQTFQFQDAPGTELLRFSQAVPPALCDDFECYVLQTNVSKKTPQPLLPLHIAWHNLLCANPNLHESVLMYEPIDLQEIYLYLKQLGHRYDPKDLKCFFDRRSIIFRYELAPPTKQAQRHVRRNPHKIKKPSSKF